MHKDDVPKDNTQTKSNPEIWACNRLSAPGIPKQIVLGQVMETGLERTNSFSMMVLLKVVFFFFFFSPYDLNQ